MVLRDKRLWFGVIAAVILAFVSYAVVADLNRSGRPDDRQHQHNSAAGRRGGHPGGGRRAAL
jgi:hypothetical protein